MKQELLSLKNFRKYFTLCAIILLGFQTNAQTNILIDFGSNLSDAPWNNITSPTSDTIIGLMNSDGTASGVSLSVTDPFNWINTAGLAPDGIDFPATATGDSFFGNSGEFSGKTEPSGAVELTGLTMGEAYTFTIFASREATDNREAQYLIEGASTETLLLNAASNATMVVTGTVMPNAEGKITVTASPGSNNDNSLGFYYFGAMKISSGQTAGPEGLIADWETLVPQKHVIFGQGTVTSTTGMVSNPDASGINTSTNVYSMCKGTGAQEWGGFWFEMDTVNTPISLVTKTVFCIDVMMPVNGVVQFKVEGGDNDAMKTAIKSDYTGNGAWQQVCYDFAGTDAAGLDFRRIAVFPNRGEQPAEEECYFIDNLVQLDELPEVLDGDLISDWDNLVPQKHVIFGQGTVAGTTGIVDNPSGDGQVYSMCKGPGAQEWGGFWFEMDTINTPISLATKTLLCIDVLMPTNGVVQLKVEGGDNDAMKTAIKSDYSGNGGWQQVCFDFAGTDAAGLDFRRIAVFPNRGVQPAEEECYFVDNFIQKEGTFIPPAITGESIADWETDETSPMINLFGGNDASSKVDNPLKDALNSSDNVLMYCKNDGSEFDGFTFFVDTIDVTGDTALVCLSMYAAEATPLRVTFGGATDGSADVSFDLSYSTAGVWEQFCIDLREDGVDDKSAVGHLYKQISVYPNYEVLASSETCYHFDNILKSTNGTGVLREFITDALSRSDDHTKIVEYISLADVGGSINKNGVTFFAPTNAAIDAIPSGLKDKLDNNVDGALINFVLHHLVNDSIPVDLLSQDKFYIGRNGIDVETKADGTVGGAAIVTGDMINKNGILHSIDKMISNPTDPASYLQDDFEVVDLQEWYGFASGDSSNVEIVANPAPDAVNGSAMVLRSKKYPNLPNVLSYQGIAVRELARPMNFLGVMTEICVDVLFEEAGNMRWKLEQPQIRDFGDQKFLPRYQIDAVSPGQWETLCTDVTQPSLVEDKIPGGGEIFNRLSVFFDYAWDVWPDHTTNYYIDNIVVKNTTVGVNNIEKLENFFMFPNPTSQSFSINSDTPIHRARIFDLMGRQVMEVINPVQTEISVSHLENGIYLVDFYSENNQRLGTAKLIKQ